MLLGPKCTQMGRPIASRQAKRIQRADRLGPGLLRLRLAMTRKYLRTAPRGPRILDYDPENFPPCHFPSFFSAASGDGPWRRRSTRRNTGSSTSGFPYAIALEKVVLQGGRRRHFTGIREPGGGAGRRTLRNPHRRRSALWPMPASAPSSTAIQKEAPILAMVSDNRATASRASSGLTKARFGRSSRSRISRACAWGFLEPAIDQRGASSTGWLRQERIMRAGDREPWSRPGGFSGPRADRAREWAASTLPSSPSRSTR